MTAFILYLCIFLSELVSFSLSQITVISCPETVCVVIDEHKCCGKSAGGPKLPSSVTVRSEPNKDKVSVPVEAGFNSLNHLFTSSPTCSQTFSWPASRNKVLRLKFTERLALVYASTGTVIKQIFGETCTHEDGLADAINPYYDPNPESSSDEDKNSKNPPETFFEPSDPATWDSIDRPATITQQSSGIDHVDDSLNTETPIIAPTFDFGSSPIKVASTIDTSLNTVRSDEDDYTGYGYIDLTPVMQDNTSIFKRGTPVQFHA